ncbi:hypothetical protein [Pseudomonas protegens]|uniref:hypothetical protein n=1 Tax=Pseudomonas protegens TaxID=380021 RepID=UPI000CD175BB|nr:hypothetical protein [Pseudomonas protegens]POA88022.1 hypothetical protein C1883_16190 [Pseudomonas protegens]
MSDASPVTTPILAAQQAVLELIKASGSDLFKNKGVSAAAGQSAAEFVVEFHKTLTEYYKTLG